jgi:hypothetical protein
MQIPLIMEQWVPAAPTAPSPPGSFAGVQPGGVILIVHNVQVVNHRSNLGTFVVLATPHHLDGQEGSEEASRERLRTAAGLLGAVMGKNAIFDPVFSFEIDSAGNAVNIGSVAFQNPGWFRIPNLSQDGLGLIESFSLRISALAPKIRDRTHLSLRWLYQAMGEPDGVFSFLKYWIAIETLAMPDGTNIRPVIRRLSLAYSHSEAKVRETFAIGRLFDLRGQIVHHGRAPLIGQDLLAYVEAIYVDLLAQVVGVQSGCMAENALKRSGNTAVALTQAATPVARRRLRVNARTGAGAGVTVVTDAPDNTVKVPTE